MSLTYGFYNSLDGDRKYDAIQLSRILDGVVKDGVFATIGSALLVTPGTGMEVVVGTGRAWFNHTWTYNDALLPISVELPDLIFNRIDTIILEVNANDANRENSIKIIKGTPASSPVPQVLTNDAYLHQYPLAYIAVNLGATEILAANITNKVGSSACPFVTGLFDTIETDDLLAQWNGEFDIWFNEIKGQLSTDAAGNLQAQIDALPTKTSGAEVATGTDDFKYITAKAIKDSLNVPNVIPGVSGNILTSNGTNWFSSAPLVQHYAVQGRLSLVSGDPFPQADQTGKGTLYFTPYKGNRITLWDGSAWRSVPFSEVSIVIPDRAPSRTGTVTKGSATISNISNTADLAIGMYVNISGYTDTGLVINSKTANTIVLNSAPFEGPTGSTTQTLSFPETRARNYDVFALIDGANIKLDLNAWPSDTSRFALGTKDGVYVKNTYNTHRYLGTVRFNGQTSRDTTADRWVWNYYNRVPRVLRNVNANSHSYTTAQWRLFGGAVTGHQVTMVIGVAEEPVLASGLASWAASASTIIANFALGIDSSTAPSDDVRQGGWIQTVYNVHTPWEYYNMAAGYRVINLLENWISGATAAWSAGGVVGSIMG